MGLDFLRTASWLGRKRVRGYVVLLALLNVAILVFLVATSRDGVDRNGFLLGSDFISFWTAGRMLLSGGEVYDMAAHIAAQRAFFAPEEGFTAFFYPPSFLPFCYPLGLLGYFPALLGWLALTAAVYVLATRPWLREAGVEMPAILLFAAFPPVLITVTHGQTSFLVAALLGAGAWCVRSRPLLAGVLFGLATIKPQLGLLVPVALLATGQWRVIMSAGVAAVLLAAFSAAVSGPEIWSEWLAIGDKAQEAMSQGVVGYDKMVSPFAAVMLLGAPAALAYALQALVSLGVAAAIAFSGIRQGWTPLLGALVLAGAPLATPFVLDYDLVLLAFPLAMLAARPFAPWEKIGLALAFVAPAFARPLAMEAGIPIMVPVMLLMFLLLWKRARRADRRTPAAATA